MLLAAFHLAHAVCADLPDTPDEPVVEIVQQAEPITPIVEPVITAPEVIEHIAEPQPMISQPKPIESVKEEPKPVRSNMEAPADLHDYASMFGEGNPKEEPVVEDVPSLTLAEQFMFVLLHAPLVARMQLHEFNHTSFAPGQVAAYLWISENSITPSILQYSAIVTKYGNVYVACELDDNGALKDKDAPLEVYYDSPSLKQMVVAAVYNDLALAASAHMFNPDKIQTEEDLMFFFGMGRYGADINLGHRL